MKYGLPLTIMVLIIIVLAEVTWWRLVELM
jgi:hypothetical protein